MGDLCLCMYDLSKGMAQYLSSTFFKIDGIWHTSVIAFNNEYYFGTNGIISCKPNESYFGKPDKIIYLGGFELPRIQFIDIIRQMSNGSYRPGSYNLLNHNCNNFSYEISMILVGKPVPAHIINLPEEIINKFFNR